MSEEIDALTMEGSIRYRKGYKYQLAADYTVMIPFPFSEERGNDYLVLYENFLTIKSGYAWDGASGPTVDTPSVMRASLVHDAFYQLMREGLFSNSYRWEVDRLFKRMLIADGVPRWRAWLWHRAVSKAAEKFSEPESIKKVYIAP